MNPIDRIEEVRRSGLKSRLLRGSAILGKLWHEGVRCKAGWSMKCPCGDGETEFCGAKGKWIGILRDYHRDSWPYGLTGSEPFFVVEAMTASMFDASGMTIRIETPEGAELRVGPKGTDWKTIFKLTELQGTADYQEAIEAVVAIQTVLK